MAWKDYLSPWLMDMYNSVFWNSLANQDTIATAHQKGYDYSRNTGFCDSLIQEKWRLWFPNCGLDSMYNGSSTNCGSLSSGNMAQEIPFSSSLTKDHEVKPSNAMLEKTKETIHVFTNSPVMNIESL